MKNIWISFVVFAVMLFLMTISINYLNTTCAKFQKSADTLELLLNQDRWKEAYDLSNNIYDRWEKQSTIIPVFVNHAEVDSVNNEVMKLTQYVKFKSKDEALASTHAIKFYLKSINALQQINIQNIF
ncbi:DUF4363 family protein [Clostridium oryzae]|uniref:DUF4363 family protein n=1 Tax=Clostridium oryzae TaxID=1450648 RepID=A0A1V4IJD7_9CLOT|nr:DUF4363 family protein [Clostridium oryzae]OPJ60111.1 hypothetical protein CLORY_29740 [Clostridium oryzae]